jgi:hypothetical protein
MSLLALVLIHDRKPPGKQPSILYTFQNSVECFLEVLISRSRVALSGGDVANTAI